LIRQRRFLEANKPKVFASCNYVPHSKAQYDAHMDDRRFKVLTCGRRWGKSIFAGNEFTSYLFIPETVWWIVGPTYKLAEKEFRVIWNNLTRKLGLKRGKDFSGQYNANQGNMRIEMPWNTILEAVSADKPDSLVGEGLDGVIMSEAAKHRMETWQMYIEPALADKRGCAVFPSTPQGFNWYYGLHLLGEASEHPDYLCMQLPSWLNPVAFPGGYEDPEIKRLKTTTSKEWFDQEIGAQFTSFEGQIYSEFEPKIHVRKVEYQPAWKNYWAFDFGFTAQFVCLDIMTDPMDNVYVWREYLVKGKTTWEHCQVLKERENPRGFHVDMLFADPRGADQIATMNMFLGAVVARPVGWDLGIEAVKRWMKVQEDGQPKLFISPDCPETIRQLQGLRRMQGTDKKNPREGQVDYDDHAPDALRYFFSEWEVLGARGGGLSDVYDAAYKGSEAETFFKLNSGVTMDTSITY
jgi:hypothetical protein